MPPVISLRIYSDVKSHRIDDFSVSITTSLDAVKVVQSSRGEAEARSARSGLKL